MMMLIAYQTLAFCTCHLYLLSWYLYELSENTLGKHLDSHLECNEIVFYEFRLSDLNLIIFLTWIIVNITKSSLSSDTDLEDPPWCLVKFWRQKKNKVRIQKLIWFWRKWNVNTADNSCNQKASSKPVSYLKGLDF